MKKRYLLAGLTGVVVVAVAAKLLTRPTAVSWPDSLGFIYNAEYAWVTSINGVRIHYQEAGDEKALPIILIHGFISSNLIWRHVLKLFFFQAEDGIRDLTVTGVQTCALPI